MTDFERIMGYGGYLVEKNIVYPLAIIFWLFMIFGLPALILLAS